MDAKLEQMERLLDELEAKVYSTPLSHQKSECFLGHLIHDALFFTNSVTNLRNSLGFSACTQ